MALDFGDVDNTLYAAAAKGADRIVKIADDGARRRLPARAAAALCRGHQAARGRPGAGRRPGPRRVGRRAVAVPGRGLGLPYVGVIRGVHAGSEPGTVVACKEFPGAVMARMNVKLPAVLGILGADQPPRYVPVSRIRAAMKSTQFEECAAGGRAASSR